MNVRILFLVWIPLVAGVGGSPQNYISDVATEKGRDEPRDIPVVGPRHAKHARLLDGHNLNWADLTRLSPIQRIRSWTNKQTNEWKKTNGSHWLFSSFIVLTFIILWCSVLNKKYVTAFCNKDANTQKCIRNVLYFNDNIYLI